MTSNQVITGVDVKMTSGWVYAAQWGNLTAEEAARQILSHLNQPTWPRLAPSYGTTGTRRLRKARR